MEKVVARNTAKNTMHEASPISASAAPITYVKEDLSTAFSGSSGWTRTVTASPTAPRGEEEPTEPSR